MNVVGAHELGLLIAGSPSPIGGAIAAWHAEASAAAWSSNADVRRSFPRAEFKGSQLLFDLGHDDHCVVVRVNYEVGAVLMTYVGPRAGAPRGKSTARPRKGGA